MSSVTRTETEANADTPFAAEWKKWHANHERLRADPQGFLAVSALHWIGLEPEVFEGTPGRWWVSEDVVHVELAAGEKLQRDGAELNPGGGPTTLSFGPIAERDGFNLKHGSAVIELAKRGGEYILRPRDPNTSLLASYQGTPSYAPNQAFEIQARYVPFKESRNTTVDAAVDRIKHQYQAPGEVRFELGGQKQTLTAFAAGAPGTFLVLFTDETSGKTTYAANRSLTFKAADDGGPTVLDFNRAVNLPCAYTDLATCPLPPAENRLKVAVEAGEKTPLERDGAA